MRKIIALLGALVMAVTLVAFSPVVQRAEAKPYVPAVVCKQAIEPLTMKTLLKQSTTGPWRKNIYVDVIQNYNICLNKLGPDYVVPTNWRIRYDSEHKITCRKDTPAGVGEGMVAVRFTFHFYHYKGTKSIRMPKQKVMCDGMTNSIYGRWGRRSSPHLVWESSSKTASMIVRASIDYQGFVVGVPDATGVMKQKFWVR